MYPTFAQDEDIITHDQDVAIPALEASEQSTHDVLRQINAGIASLVHMQTKEYELTELIEQRTLTASEMILDRKGRRYLVIWSPVAVTGCALNLWGITGYTFTLAAGWNVVNAPDRSILTGPASGSQLIIIKCTNWFQGSAL